VAIVEELASRGLLIAEVAESSRLNFEMAAEHLSRLPTLEAVVNAEVDEITLLDAPPGYDISHSEPKWQGRIFVSSPPEGGEVAGLRVLENVIHETMHLQLTRYEDSYPLVRDHASRHFSPWKREERETQGILHGVYVFICIAALFAEPRLVRGLGPAGIDYAARRRAEIDVELRCVDMQALATALSPKGQELLSRLITSH
jgi:HEXXH motif-containing protein